MLLISSPASPQEPRVPAQTAPGAELAAAGRRAGGPPPLLSTGSVPLPGRAGGTPARHGEWGVQLASMMPARMGAGYPRRPHSSMSSSRTGRMLGAKGGYTGPLFSGIMPAPNFPQPQAAGVGRVTDEAAGGGGDSGRASSDGSSGYGSPRDTDFATPTSSWSRSASVTSSVRREVPPARPLTTVLPPEQLAQQLAALVPQSAQLGLDVAAGGLRAHSPTPTPSGVPASVLPPAAASGVGARGAAAGSFAAWHPQGPDSHPKCEGAGHAPALSSHVHGSLGDAQLAAVLAAAHGSAPVGRDRAGSEQGVWPSTLAAAAPPEPAAVPSPSGTSETQPLLLSR